MLRVKGNPLIPVSIQSPDGNIENLGPNVPWSSLELDCLELPDVVDIEHDSESGNVYATFEITYHERENEGDIIHTKINIKDIYEFSEYSTPEQCKVVYNMLVDKWWG